MRRWSGGGDPVETEPDGAPEHDRNMYGWRHLVENLLAGAREFRAIATRHDRTDESFAAGLAPSPAWWPRRDCQQALAQRPRQPTSPAYRTAPKPAERSGCSRTPAASRWKYGGRR